jgi:hypothetical protein
MFLGGRLAGMESDRLRRCILVCCHFARNVAYHRSRPQGRGRPHEVEFWNTADGNFLDVAVLEWCKLFDTDARQGWKKVVSDKETFERAMLAALDVTAEEFEKFIQEMRRYRDKFVAHLDSDKVADIPHLELAKRAVQIYHQHIWDNELEPSAKSNLPSDLEAYYQERLAEGAAIYAQVSGGGK